VLLPSPKAPWVVFPPFKNMAGWVAQATLNTLVLLADEVDSHHGSAVL
jgi:hypothetical protein